MENSSGKGGETRNTKCRWGEGRKNYTCGDGINLSVANRTSVYKDRYGWKKDFLAPSNGIWYQLHNSSGRRHSLFISETEFDWDISELVNGAGAVRTIIFPNTIV